MTGSSLVAKRKVEGGKSRSNSVKLPATVMRLLRLVCAGRDHKITHGEYIVPLILPQLEKDYERLRKDLSEEGKDSTEYV